MELGFDIRIIKCWDKSVFVSLENIDAKDEKGESATVGAVGERFESLDAALDYARGLHDAVTLLQNTCTLVETPVETPVTYDKDKDVHSSEQF